MTNLLAKAKAATPGPWDASDWSEDDGPNKFTVGAISKEVLSEGQSSIWPNGIAHHRIAETTEGENPLADAAYIAAASPDVIIALLEERERMREALRKIAEPHPLKHTCPTLSFIDMFDIARAALGDET